MMMFSIGLIFFLLKSLLTYELFESPCPELFEYTAHNNKTGKYVGNVVLLSKTDLFDVKIQLTFDKPFIKIANNFGEVTTTNGSEYFIERSNFKLQANKRRKFCFVLKYTVGDVPPMLVSFKLNGHIACASLDSICGTRTKVNKLDNYDFEIQETEQGQYPWYAALYYTVSGDNVEYLCGGSLISKSHVITSAISVTQKNPDNFTVYLGQYYRNRLLQPDIVQERRVAKIIFNPEQFQGSLRNIALVKFTLPVEFTDYVRPICLWKESVALRSIVGKQGILVGWGLRGTNQSTDRLLQLNFKTARQISCPGTANPRYNISIKPVDTYCQETTDGLSVCRKHLGAGMFFPLSTSNLNHTVWQLRGLVSSAIDIEEGQACGGPNYVIFTDVAKHIEWIKFAMMMY